MSTLHNRGPPAAWQGPGIKINQRTANAAVMPTSVTHPPRESVTYPPRPSVRATPCGGQAPYRTKAEPKHDAAERVLVPDK